VITLLGAADISMECGTIYTDAGATASDDEDGDLTGDIIQVGSVNANLEGTYVITYNVIDSDGNSAAQVARTVTISDNTPPSVVRVGPATVTQACGTPFLDLGATATDACDGTLSVVVETELDLEETGTYTVTYRATDSAGHTATATRTVIVEDTRGPEITMLGGSPLALECGTPYVEPGATALDACDGQEAEVSIVANTVNATTPGTYSVTYQATDLGGAVSVITREVVVADTDAPSIDLHGSEVIEIDCGTVWTDPGATAIDACDGPVTVLSDAEDVVDTSTAGTYEISYVSTDSLGQQSVATRTVIVGGPVCDGGSSVCALAEFTVVQPANDTVVIPSGSAQEPILFSALATYQNGAACAGATTRVTYSVDGIEQTSQNGATGFPAVYFLGAGEYTVQAVAEIVESGSTLEQEFQLTVVAAPDSDNDGLVDAPFTALPVEGDSWTAGTVASGTEGTTTMVTWFGECEGASGDSVEVRVRNPENTAQVLAVSVDRAVLECGEQGVLTVALGERLENILDASEAQQIPAVPEGVAEDGPFFDVTIIVSSDGGDSFVPIASSRLAARPVEFTLSGVTIPDAETASFVRFPTTAVADGNGGFDLEAGSGSWSSAAIQNVSAEGSTITGDAVSLSLFAPSAPESEEGKDPNGPACAPGRGAMGNLSGDLLLVAGLLALLVWRGRSGAIVK